MNEDIIEFYHPNKACPFESVRSSVVPPVGSRIAIDRHAFTVVAVTYAVDKNQGAAPRRMRACVEVEVDGTNFEQKKTKGAKV